jgi:predicted glutamine amidotransferase
VKTSGQKDGGRIVHIGGQAGYVSHKTLVEYGVVEADASLSKDYGRVCADVEEKRLAGIFLVHLRKASSGEKVLENTAPFIKREWSFSHSGTVYELGSGDVSNSRVLFRILVGQITDMGDTVEGIRVTVNEIKVNHKYSSNTFLLAKSGSFYANRDYNQDEDYYLIKYASPEDSILVSSQEEIWNLKWNIIPNRSMVMVGKDLKVEGPLKV